MIVFICFVCKVKGGEQRKNGVRGEPEVSAQEPRDRNPLQESGLSEEKALHQQQVQLGSQEVLCCRSIPDFHLLNASSLPPP